MLHIVLAVVAAAVSVFAYPPFGPGWLILIGVSLFLTALRKAPDRVAGAVVGIIYGLGFFTGLMWWLSQLGIIALIPLMVVQASFLILYSLWLSGHNEDPPLMWWVYAVGGWALMELIRYRFPVGGLEWGAAGYALSDASWSRAPAATIGTTGLTIVIVMIGAIVALAVTRRLTWRAGLSAGSVIVVVVSIGFIGAGPYRSNPVLGPRIVIVQGSTPCPYEACPPDQRLRTFEQHLELTKTIEATEEAGGIGLVIWSEGSTGSTNADPVQNPEIGEAIGEQARRLNSWFLVGSDRPLDDETWVNANVVFNPQGEIVGEYRKQHGVPFGEYIPLRPLFEWIPELSAVPRDMIPGDGPFILGTAFGEVGSVISFEGGFARYPRENARQGATMLVVATNEGSYGTTPASDQFIGMTRMRATELQIPVAHAAVTGKSVFIDRYGNLSPTTGLASIELLETRYDEYGGISWYARYGDVVMWLAAAAAIALWVTRRWVVGSRRASESQEDQDVTSVGESAP